MKADSRSSPFLKKFENQDILLRLIPRRTFWRVAIITRDGIFWRAYRRESCPNENAAVRRAIRSLMKKRGHDNAKNPCEPHKRDGAHNASDNMPYSPSSTEHHDRPRPRFRVSWWGRML